jgi:putative transposase
MTDQDVVVAKPPHDDEQQRPDQSLAEQLVEQARADGVDLVGPGGLLAGLTKQVLEAGLEVEMDEHLGYAKHAVDGRNGGNSRNGTRSKTVLTEIGPVEVEVPRDRDSSFEPQTVRKGQRRLDGVDSMVISLTAKGLTTGEVEAHLAEVYSTTISRETISKITDRVLGELAEWQTRPLDRVYPVVFIDAIVVKIRDGQVANRPIYVAMGINLEGERDVLGLWVGPAGGEGAKFWMSLLTELRNRGVQDTFIVCCDGQGSARCDPGHLAPRRGPAVCRAPGAVVAALHVQEALGADLPGTTRDLHRPHPRRRRGPLRRVRRRLA